LSLITICYLNGTLDVVQIAAKQAVNTPEQFHMTLAAQSMPPEKIWTGGVPADAVPPSPGIFNWNLFANGALQFDPFNASGFFAHHNGGYIIGAIVLIACC